MRLRNVPGSREALAQSPCVVQADPELAGRWAQSVWKNDHPIHLEIGTGKGRFLMQMAALHPEIDYLGVELQASVLIRAVQKAEQDPLPNLRFLCADALNLETLFAPGETDRIYLNFSDPWPKDRHAKRRLTSPRFLALYDHLLAPDGQLEFKTDNQALFDYSLETLPSCGWDLTAVTRDLHRDPVLGEGNVMTEYEEKFSQNGQPICKLIARRARKSVL